METLGFLEIAEALPKLLKSSKKTLRRPSKNPKPDFNNFSFSEAKKTIQSTWGCHFPILPMVRTSFISSLKSSTAKFSGNPTSSGATRRREAA